MKLSADNRQLRGLLKARAGGKVSYVTTRVIANFGRAYVRHRDDQRRRREGSPRPGRDHCEGRYGRLPRWAAARRDLGSPISLAHPGDDRRFAQQRSARGDNSDAPRLVYLATPEAVKSRPHRHLGEGASFPPGLPVGWSPRSCGGPRVEPYVEMSQLGYLMVVDYGLSGALPQPIPPATRPGRRSKTASGE